jgi:Domain of unknown function (DUF4398)
MPSRVRLLPALALCAALAGAACSTPPDKEIQQAQSAIDAARAAGADRFASDEFAAATDALKRANAAVAERDYRLALNHALDARERAQSAAKEAAGRKEAARRDANRALTEAGKALTDSQAKLKAAEAARPPAALLAHARMSLADAARDLQKARTTFEQADYRGALDAATTITATVRRISSDLDAAAAGGTHRRRGGPRRN